MEWWLSIMRLLPLHPSAQLEPRGGFRLVFLPAAVGPESLSRSVFRRRCCSLCWSFDFELQRESRLAVDCRSFAESLVPRPVRRRRRCRFSRRSEEHTSELQSQSNLVCRLLLEKKKKNTVNVLSVAKEQKN